MKTINYCGLGAACAIAVGAVCLSFISQAKADKIADKTSEIQNVPLKVTNFPLGQNGLYFGGKKGVDYAFGPRITPHGDCITAIPGFVFVSWYKGPRSDRHLQVSRLNLQTGIWKHVQLPERNTLGHVRNCPGHDDSCGESHRTAAVEVCPLDGTVHLLFDMHANELQYIVSQPETALLPDEQFTAAQFKPKQNYFIPGHKVTERITYPSFERNERGEVFALWREGGSGNGNMAAATYDGAWSKPYVTWIGKYDDPTKNLSIYGGQQYLRGKMVAGFHIRTPATKIELNQGLYFAQGGQKLSDDWKDLAGQAHPIPIQDLSPFMIDEPAPSNDFRISGSPQWTVSEAGDVHIIITITGKPHVHYYRPAGAKTFIKSPKTDAPGGELYASGNKIFALGLKNGQLALSYTLAGKDEWKPLEIAQTKALEFGNSIEQDGVLYFFGMEKIGDPQSQPLTVLAVDLKQVR